MSGGERKRVSIGHEMLINPSVLMLDGARLPQRCLAARACRHKRSSGLMSSGLLAAAVCGALALGTLVLCADPTEQQIQMGSQGISLVVSNAGWLAEPTSGLDSTTAMHVLEILRGLATGGRAVLTTIHQACRARSGCCTSSGVSYMASCAASTGMLGYQCSWCQCYGMGM